MIGGPLKWHGGKSYLAAWHHEIAKRARPYTTRLYGCMGGWGEGWNWEHEGIAEICNDLNGSLTNFWRVLQNPSTFDLFKRYVEAVPFSRVEWNDAVRLGDVDDTINAAVHFFIRYRQSRQGIGDVFATVTKKRTRRGMNEQVSAWLSSVEGLTDAHKRLIRVLIECMPVLQFVQQYRAAEYLMYLDVPYLSLTRTVSEVYEYEMSIKDHDDLLYELLTYPGQFMLCGYDNELYENYRKHAGWNRFDMEIDNKSGSGATKQRRVESVWTNF